MKRLVCIIALLVISCTVLSAARPSETYIEFDIMSRDEISVLTKVVSIDNVKDLTITAYANDDQLARLAQLGYSYKVLPAPSSLIVPRMSTDKADIADWDVYPTYDAYVAMMYQFETDYPGLCRIELVGNSVEGRQILFARISDNVTIEEDEPEVMYTSSMHGDETTGYVLTLRLIDYLLSNYGTDSLATRLVDSCEIWINPLANPDGTYAGGNSSVYGATRYNANGVDLNRNFPDPKSGPHPDGNSWQQETQVMMALAEAHSFVISGNFHGGAEVVNYPWDTWSRLHVDNDWFYYTSRDYADSAHYYSPSGYLTDLDDGITNGYAWYSIDGGRQDYMNFWHGCRESTFEISGTKLLPAYELPDYWDYNKVSFLNYLENGLYGIRGIVSDAVTGDPVYARIAVVGHDADQDSSYVYSDPDVGDYHRMIQSGAFDIEVTAPGYAMYTAYNVSVTDYTGTRVDIGMTELTDAPDLAIYALDAGLIDPGEYASFHISLQNSGIGNGSGLQGDIESPDAYVTIIQGTSAYPTVQAGGGTAESIDAYQIAVSSDCPSNHIAAFDLILTGNYGYNDTLSFSMLFGQTVEDFESAGFSYLDWTMSGGQNWQLTATDPYEGFFSVRSGTISHNQSSGLSVTFDVLAPGDIKFYYKVSSESGSDYLRFKIDGVEKDAWSGASGWTEAVFPVTMGEHTFMWEYTKDGSSSVGDDHGWIDYIIFPPVDMSAPPTIITETLPDWTAGFALSQQLEATGGTGSLTWTDKNDNLTGTGLTLSATGLLTGAPLTSGVISFTAKVTDEALLEVEQPLNITINPALNIDDESLPDGVTGASYSHQLTSTGGTGSTIWIDKNGDLTGTGLTLSASGLLSGIVVTEMTVNFLCRAEDAISAYNEQAMSVTFADLFICGDANGDGSVDVGDALYIINFVFKGGPAPESSIASDPNFDGDVNVGDAVYLISYIFKYGPDPVCE